MIEYLILLPFEQEGLGLFDTFAIIKYTLKYKETQNHQSNFKPNLKNFKEEFP